MQYLEFMSFITMCSCRVSCDLFNKKHNTKNKNTLLFPKNVTVRNVYFWLIGLFLFQWISGLWDALWASLSKGRSCFQEMTVSFIYPRCTSFKVLPLKELLPLPRKTEECIDGCII